MFFQPKLLLCELTLAPIILSTIPQSELCLKDREQTAVTNISGTIRNDKKSHWILTKNFFKVQKQKNEFQIIIQDTNSNRHVKLLWVAEDPSGSYIIAAGVRQSTNNSNKYNGYVVKVFCLKFVVKINIFSSSMLQLARKSGALI